MIDGVSGTPALEQINKATRTVLEKRLSLAINRARKQYMEVENARNNMTKTHNPSHLGIRIDIKV